MRTWKGPTSTASAAEASIRSFASPSGTTTCVPLRRFHHWPHFRSRSDGVPVLYSAS